MGEELKKKIETLSDENRKLLDKNCALHEKLKHFQPIKESLDGKEMEYQSTIKRLNKEIETQKNVLLQMKYHLDQDAKSFVDEYKTLHQKYGKLQKLFDENKKEIVQKKEDIQELHNKYNKITNQLQCARNENNSLQIKYKETVIAKQSQKAFITNHQIYKFKQIKQLIASSKHGLNQIKNDLDFKPILFLFNAFSTSFDDIILKQKRMETKNCQLEQEINDLQQQLSIKHKSNGIKKLQIKHRSNGIKSKENIPKKIKNKSTPNRPSFTKNDKKRDRKHRDEDYNDFV